MKWPSQFLTPHASAKKARTCPRVPAAAAHRHCLPPLPLSHKTFPPLDFGTRSRGQDKSCPASRCCLDGLGNPISGFQFPISGSCFPRFSILLSAFCFLPFERASSTRIKGRLPSPSCFVFVLCSVFIGVTISIMQVACPIKHAFVSALSLYPKLVG